MPVTVNHPAMTASRHIDALNDLLIEMGRSLLQYVGECWPWTGDEHADIHKKLSELIARQQENVTTLATELHSHRTDVDLGTYPTEHTDLHYVGVDFLIDHLVANQEHVVATVQETAEAVADDPRLAQLLAPIVKDEQEILDELEKLAD
jgi:DNA-binding ferritin-like protein